MRKLEFDMIPDGCWKYNLRNILSKRLWDFIKTDAKKRAQDKCRICGKVHKRLEAHEKWKYDEKNGVIILDDVLAICPDCHKAIHIGRTALTGDVKKIEDHYMKVNSCSYAEMKEDLRKANEVHRRRNQVDEWKMDISWLKRFV